MKIFRCAYGEIHNRLELLAIIALSVHALTAAATEPPAPGSGTFLQQLQPTAPPVPSSNDSTLNLERQRASELPPSAPFLITRIDISGNTTIQLTTLHALVADAEGLTLTLPQLNARVSRISDYYHHHGYPLARAVIPAQTIRDGVVAVEVIEARYGKVILENQSRVRSELLESTLAPLKSGDIIEQASLDHALLLMSDIPNVNENATLKAGATPGTSDLIVQTTQRNPVTGGITLDDDGNRYTGRTQGSGDLQIDDPLRHGDILNASFLTAGKGLEYGRVLYDVILDGSGTHLGVAYSGLHYLLGDSLAALEGHGTAKAQSLWMQRPLLRTPDLNLYVRWQYDHKRLSDDIDASSIRNDRHLNNLTLTVSGDLRDAWLTGGSTSWNLQWLAGRVGFDNPIAQQTDADTARTDGAFRLWNAAVTRSQRLTGTDVLSIAISYQRADGNLDESQKLVVGGAQTVRSYDTNALSADSGFLTNVEARHDFSSTRSGQWQGIGFFDLASLTVNQDPWTAGKNQATLRGTGVGLAWTSTARFTARANLGLRLGAAPALVGDSSRVRTWIQLNERF
jgi:hemolysin activation/secretion protein